MVFWLLRLSLEMLRNSLVTRKRKKMLNLFSVFLILVHLVFVLTSLLGIVLIARGRDLGLVLFPASLTCAMFIYLSTVLGLACRFYSKHRASKMARTGRRISFFSLTPPSPRHLKLNFFLSSFSRFFSAT